MSDKTKIFLIIILVLILIIGFVIIYKNTMNKFENISLSNENGEYKENFKTVNSSEFQYLSDRKNTVIIDMRTPQEIKDTGVIYATEKFIDFSDTENFKKQLNILNKNDNYLIYCRSGARSKAAMDIMQKEGFLSVNELEGGILRWFDSGLSLVPSDYLFSK